MLVQLSLCRACSESTLLVFPQAGQPKFHQFIGRERKSAIVHRHREGREVVQVDFEDIQITVQYERPRGKTNNMVSEQVQHKPTCTSTEKS